MYTHDERVLKRQLVRSEFAAHYAEDAPNEPTYLEIEFEGGDPVAINGERMSPATMLTALNKYGGDNGIGRLDIVESRFVGMKSRGVYETPGGARTSTRKERVNRLISDETRRPCRVMRTLNQSSTQSFDARVIVFIAWWFQRDPARPPSGGCEARDETNHGVNVRALGFRWNEVNARPYDSAGPS